MALTSPSNLFSPDAGDGYALVTDLAAMQDSVQEALVIQANYGAGTTTARNANLATFPDGAKWYDTTLSAEYLRVAGAWVVNNSGGPYNYVWANAAARTAQAGMIAGQKGYQTDTAATYNYTGGAWVIYDTGWVDLTPAIGSGTLRYRAEGGWVTVEIDIDATFSTGVASLSASGAIPSALRPGTTARAAAYMGSLTDSTVYLTTSGTAGLINSTGSSQASVGGTIVWHVA